MKMKKKKHNKIASIASSSKTSRLSKSIARGRSIDIIVKPKKGVSINKIIYTRKLFVHGSSRAINLPKEFVELLPSDKVNLKIENGSMIIDPVEEMDNIESEPEFESFIQSIAKDALSHPEKLEDLTDINDKLWDLVKDVPLDEEN